MIDELKQYIEQGTCCGVVRSTNGETRMFQHRGVSDLLALVEKEPEILRGATVADKVAGRGAALLLVKGGVSEVYVRTISAPALDVLNAAGIKVSFGRMVPHIINRDGTDICPVEKLTSSITEPEEAFDKIKQFVCGL